MATAMDAKQRVPGSGTIVALNVPAFAAGKRAPVVFPTAGVNPSDIPVAPSKVPILDVKVRSGAESIRVPALVPEVVKVAEVNVAVRKFTPVPPAPVVNSIFPVNVIPLPVKPPGTGIGANVSNKTKPGGSGVPPKFETMTGMDSPPPSTLPAVDSVVTPPLTDEVTESLGFNWENCRMVPALVDDPSRSDATHANAKERRKNRADFAS